MTTIEARVVKIEEGKRYGKFEINEGDVLERNGETEIVREIHREEGRVVRFRTVKRKGESIIENDYCVDAVGAALKANFSGIYYSEDTGQFSRSARYSELNDFLQKSGM